MVEREGPLDGAMKNKNKRHAIFELYHSNDTFSSIAAPYVHTSYCTGERDRMWSRAKDFDGAMKNGILNDMQFLNYHSNDTFSSIAVPCTVLYG